MLNEVGLIERRKYRFIIKYSVVCRPNQEHAEEQLPEDPDYGTFSFEDDISSKEIMIEETHEEIKRHIYQNMLEEEMYE